MKYRSTRGATPLVTFSDAVLTGLADDGGLLVPVAIPFVENTTLEEWKALDYKCLSFCIMRKFISSDEISDDDLLHLIGRSLEKFRLPEIAPLTSMGDIDLLELYHGPSLAFKDFALQFLGNLFEYLLEKRNTSSLIIGATSGDTGSAAIEGLRGKSRIKCVILFPKGRISKIQQLQMTTVQDSNIQCLSVDGNFDECQKIVKECFHSPLKQDLQLGAINSINWSRIMSQMVYYFYASFRRLERNPGETMVDFCVPTGNFGNILAAYYAKQMGAPIRHLIVASNSNDILTRIRQTGNCQPRDVNPTISPSMDIQVSSNFERFLYDIFGHDDDLIKEKFEELSEQGKFTIPEKHLSVVQNAIFAYSASEDETKDCIQRMFKSHGKLLDPHTAVGVVCAGKFKKDLRDEKDSVRCICVSTAHFAKFIETVEPLVEKNATEQSFPPELRGLEDLPTRSKSVPADTEAVKQFLRSFNKPTWCQLSNIPTDFRCYFSSRNAYAWSAVILSLAVAVALLARCHTSRTSH